MKTEPWDELYALKITGGCCPELIGRTVLSLGGEEDSPEVFRTLPEAKRGADYNRKFHGIECEIVRVFVPGVPSDS